MAESKETFEEFLAPGLSLCVRNAEPSSGACSPRTVSCSWENHDLLRATPGPRGYAALEGREGAASRYAGVRELRLRRLAAGTRVPKVWWTDPAERT